MSKSIKKTAKKQIRQIILEWYTKWDKGPADEIWDQVIEPLLKKERERDRPDPISILPPTIITEGQEHGQP